MNRDMIWTQEQERLRQSFAVWGKIAPELFTFGSRRSRGGKGEARHG